MSFSDKRKKMKGVETGSFVVLTQLAPMNSLLSHFPASNNCTQQMTSASQASCMKLRRLIQCIPDAGFVPTCSLPRAHEPAGCSLALAGASSDLLRAGSGVGIPHVPPHPSHSEAQLCELSHANQPP